MRECRARKKQALPLGWAEMRAHRKASARDAHLDLIRAPYVLYDVKYIDLVSLGLG